MRTSLGLLAALLLSGAVPAFGADPAGSAPADVFDWSGFYVGGQAGIVVFRGNYDVVFVGPESTTGGGGTIGVFAGGTTQTASMVLGAEIGANYDMAKSTYISGGPGSVTTTQNWDAYIRGKFGVPVSDMLLYAALGGTMSSFTQSSPFNGGTVITNIIPGVSVGVGAEADIGNGNTLRATSSTLST